MGTGQKEGEPGMNFDQAIDPLLKREGGYVNHKADRGGATNYGITQGTFSDWLGKNGKGWRDVRSLERDEAKTIYFDNYWTPAKCDLLPDNLRAIHFDAAVNHGVARASKLLQEAIGVAADGHIGPATLRAISNTSTGYMLARYVAVRYKFYGDIINRDRSQLAFIAGWMNRMSEFV